MTAGELFARILGQGIPWIPTMITIVATTLLALALLLPLTRDLWLDQKRFGYMALFFDMKAMDCVRTACAWIKMIVVITFIIQFQKLSVVDYMLIFIPGLVYALLIGSFGKMFNRILWLILQLIGMVSVNAICGYVLDLRPGVEYVILYVFLGIFLGLFALYLFINEVHDVSIERRANIGKI